MEDKNPLIRLFFKVWKKTGTRATVYKNSTNFTVGVQEGVAPLTQKPKILDGFNLEIFLRIKLLIFTLYKNNKLKIPPKLIANKKYE